MILAFDVKIERDAQEMADSVGVKIFQADIIYHLFDSFTKYQEELKQKKREEFKDIAVFPCKVRILPQVNIQVYSKQLQVLHALSRSSYSTREILLLWVSSWKMESLKRALRCAFHQKR